MFSKNNAREPVFYAKPSQEIICFSIYILLSHHLLIVCVQIVTSSYTDLQDYTYYFVPAPWLSVKLLRLLQNYPPPEDASVRTRLTECLETILNKAQEPPKSKKVQVSSDIHVNLFAMHSIIFVCTLRMFLVYTVRP